MSSRLYREMVEKAKHFYRISEYDVSLGRYDIALFHLEQAVQLAIKSYLLYTLGDFPKIHSLRELIEIADNQCLNRLSEDKWYIVDILEDAYIGSRYFIRRYGEKEYSEARKFTEEMFKCLNM
ncbi:MAG: HEPN domain-containing protein [Ignisphaera sp.]|uniref:HEPN domain-containing protein n=1 Tax=Ignisphaera aggregans TaxID=334771 RepID=A0A7J3I926_9CREN